MQGIAYLFAHVRDSLLNPNEIQLLNIAHNGSDKPLLGSNSNADVNVVAVHDRVTAVGSLNGGVDSGNVAHCKDASAGECAHETELDARLLEDLLLVCLAEIHEGRHVNFV